MSTRGAVMATGSRHSVVARARALVSTCRPVNGACTALAVLASAGAGASVHDRPIAVAAICAAAALYNAASNALNDACDIEADKVNRPARPIPSGLLDRGEALMLAGLLFGSSLAIHALVAPATLPLAMALQLLSVAYSLALKGIPLVGNLVIAAISAFTLAWAPAFLGLPVAMHPSMLAVVFAFVLAMELLKTAEDVEGDARAGVRTVATRWGVARCVRGAELALVAAAIVALGGVALHASAAVVVTLIATGLLVSVSLARPSTRRAIAILRVGQVVGIAAILVA